MLAIYFFAVHYLQISTNQLRVMTVQNVIINWIKESESKNSSGQSSNFNQMDEHCLENLKTIIGEISNPELATACASWMMQRFHKGPSGCLVIVKHELNCASSYWFL